jgi:hypothetical protein
MHLDFNAEVEALTAGTSSLCEEDKMLVREIHSMETRILNRHCMARSRRTEEGYVFHFYRPKNEKTYCSPRRRKLMHARFRKELDAFWAEFSNKGEW